MSNDDMENNRKTLFDEVWETPIYKLAKKYGLSDNGLRKRCKSWNIPLPPYGYWEKKRAGKEVVEKPQLPPAPLHSIFYPSTVQNSIGNIDDMEDEPEQPEYESARTVFSAWCKKLRVPGKVKEFDTLIEQHIKELASREEHDKDSYLSDFSFSTQYHLNKHYNDRRKNPVLAIDVSSRKRHRAYCLIEYLIQTFKELKGHVSVEPGEKDNMTLNYRGYYFQCSLSESDIKRRDLSIDLSDAKHTFRPIYEKIPSGRFHLHFESRKYNDYGRNEIVRCTLDYQDSEEATIEDQIGDIFLGVYDAVISMNKEDDRKRNEREEKDRAIQRQKEEDRQKAEIARKETEEKRQASKKVEQQKSLPQFAIEHSHQWHTAKLVHEYCMDFRSIIDNVDEKYREKVSAYLSEIEDLFDKKKMIDDICMKIDEIY